MQGNGFDIEMIEAYVLNQLSPEKKALFEEAVSRDPLLKAEVDVQKQTVQSIQSFRKAELKNRLNNIEIPANNWFSYSKIAASILILALGTGLFVYLDSSNKQPDKKEIVLSKEVPSANTEVKKEKLTEVTEAPSKAPVAEKAGSETTSAIKETVAKKEVKPAAKNLNRGNKPAAASPEITETAPNPEVKQVVIPDFSDSFDEVEDLNKSINLPDDKVAQVTETKAKLDVELVDKKGGLNYQYYNNKLFLYGEFSAKPYELLELNSHQGKELYLYFEEQYYHLESNTMDITSINAISNPKLRRQLDSIRVK